MEAWAGRPIAFKPATFYLEIVSDVPSCGRRCLACMILTFANVVECTERLFGQAGVLSRFKPWIERQPRSRPISCHSCA